MRATLVTLFMCVFLLPVVTACGDDDADDTNAGCMPDPALMQLASDAPADTAIQGRPLNDLKVGRMTDCEDPADAGTCNDEDQSGCKNPLFDAGATSVQDLFGPCACLLESSSGSAVSAGY